MAVLLINTFCQFPVPVNGIKLDPLPWYMFTLMVAFNGAFTIIYPLLAPKPKIVGNRVPSSTAFPGVTIFKQLVPIRGASVSLVNVADPIDTNGETSLVALVPVARFALNRLGDMVVFLFTPRPIIFITPCKCKTRLRY